MARYPTAYRRGSRGYGGLPVGSASGIQREAAILQGSKGDFERLIAGPIGSNPFGWLVQQPVGGYRPKGPNPAGVFAQVRPVGGFGRKGVVVTGSVGSVAVRVGGMSLGQAVGIGRSVVGLIDVLGNPGGPGAMGQTGVVPGDDLHGWILEGTWNYPWPHAGPPIHQAPYRFHSGPDGLTGQALVDVQPVGSPLPATCMQMVWMNDNSAESANPRGAVTHSWYRETIVGDGTLGPETQPVVVPLGGTGPDTFGPNLNPDSVPPGWGGVKLPIPINLVPDRPLVPTGPGVQGPQAGNSMPPAPGDTPGPGPGVGPEATVIVNPGGPPIFVVGPPPVRRPPEPGDREGKIIANVDPKALVGRIFGGLTEILDFLDAVVDGMPPKLQQDYWGKKGDINTGARTIQDKLQFIWENFDQIDIAEAVQAVLLNQIEDALIGKLGKKAQQMAQRQLQLTGRPVGLGTGRAL